MKTYMLWPGDQKKYNWLVKRYGHPRGGQPGFSPLSILPLSAVRSSIALRGSSCCVRCREFAVRAGEAVTQNNEKLVQLLFADFVVEDNIWGIVSI
jgi:hypothetical protein